MDGEVVVFSGCIYWNSGCEYPGGFLTYLDQ
jgi:hypothetical protein